MALRRTPANLNFQRHDKELQRHRRRQPRCQCRGQQRKVLPSQQRKQRLAKGRLTESIPNKEMNAIVQRFMWKKAERAKWTRIFTIQFADI